MRNLKQLFSTRLTRVFLAIFVILVLLVFENYLLMLRFERIEKTKPTEWGVSFSQVQAERFGSDWRQNYLALLQDLKFKNIRIPVYWDRIEKSPGSYDFSEVDWMLDEALKNDTRVTLVIGQKNIRYPECFYPAWLNTSDSKETSERALQMIEKSANHFRYHKAVAKWQLENEFLLKSFGKCSADNLTNSQLQKELNVLKSVDSTRPIVMTQSDQFGFPLMGPFANEFGFSMYRWSWDKSVGYWRYPQNGHYFWWKAAIISLLYDQSIKIHELQAEPWGPIGNEEISSSEANRTMNPSIFRDNIEYAKQTRIRSIDLWGAEWWWHEKQNGRSEMWEAIRAVISNN